MRFCNLHQHSSFSDGRNTPEEIVERAIKLGLASIGFSDHSYTAIDTSYCLQPEDYTKYLNEIKRLKEKYRGEIEIFTGLELDYFSEVKRKDFDYIIASIHYMVYEGKRYGIDHNIKQLNDCINNVFCGEKNAFAKAYYNQFITHIEKNKPDIVGHYDVITKFGVINEEDTEYQKIAADAMRRILKTTKIVEMNTGAVARGYKKIPYPAPFLLDVIRDEGGDIVITSDSHKKENIDFYFKESVEILKKHGFKHFLILTSNGFVKEYL